MLVELEVSTGKVSVEGCRVGSYYSLAITPYVGCVAAIEHKSLAEAFKTHEGYKRADLFTSGRWRLDIAVAAHPLEPISLFGKVFTADYLVAPLYCECLNAKTYEEAEKQLLAGATVRGHWVKFPSVSYQAYIIPSTLCEILIR